MTANFFELGQLQDSHTNNHCLFGLGHRLVDFSTKEPAEDLENEIQTRISASEQPAGGQRAEDILGGGVSMDGHFEVDFMEEHSFILKKYIGNYTTLFSMEGQTLPMPRSELGGYSCLTDALALLQSRIQNLTGTKMHIALSGLFQNEKVVGLLNGLLQEYEQRVSVPLLLMGVLVWTEYSQLADKNLEEWDIIQFSNRLLTSSFLRKLNNILSGEDVDLHRLKQFANVFVNTLMFVASEYFVNPYYQLEEELLVRDYQHYQLFLYDASITQEEEDEESEQLTGRKLVKQW